MSEEIKEYEISLCDGFIFKYNGPHKLEGATGPLFYGVVGDYPTKSNLLITELVLFTFDEPNFWGGPEPEVAILVPESSPWILLQFIENRTEWIKEKLESVINENT